MPGKSKAKKSIYSPHPSIAMAQKRISSLKERTGRSLEEWVKLIKTQGPKSDAARRDWLKKEYELGTNYSRWLVDEATGKSSDYTDPDEYLRMAETYVDTLYGGARTVLRPVHDALIDLCRSLGKDIQICPCQTMVPIFRQHVIAQIKPTTRTRIDFGLCLKGLPANRKIPDRLIDTGGAAKGDRITHRFAITSAGEIDPMVLKWVQTAYELDA
ncbi:MAG: hypothetical protein HJJLKODD_02089 [Phycisphaerae bacterium]|nr:hypothetical protein [Phycisphaerae bacterium]